MRWSIVAHGVIDPFIVGALAWPWMQYIGALWILTFPVMAISLGVLFRRAEPI